MAVTKLLALHIHKGKTAARCYKKQISYLVNPEKTGDGEYVTSFACDPATAAAEYENARLTYLRLTGRRRSDEVIAYQLIQSFKPGEITPEEANRVGCELAARFLKGNHAYVVATHTEKEHIHNHITFCAVTLDQTHKFRNFLGSGKALGRLSDQICLEHRLSVITNPRYRDSHYDRWLGDKVKLTSRDQLRTAIDEMLQKNPDGFDALMRLLEEAGWRIKHGKQISLCAPGGKRYMRMDTLGEAYSEQALREVLSGKREHVPQPTRRMKKLRKVSLLVDIEAKLQAGKGKGFENWAKVFNVKQLAASMAFLRDHQIDSFEQLTEMVDTAKRKNDELLAGINAAEDRLKEITELKKTIHSYLRTKAVYVEWKSSGWSKTFYAAHQQELDAHKAAKQVFDQLPGRIPTIRELTDEYAAVLEKKRNDYAEYRDNRDSMRELLTVRANIAIATGRDDKQEHPNNTQFR